MLWPDLHEVAFRLACQKTNLQVRSSGRNQCVTLQAISVGVATKFRFFLLSHAKHASDRVIIWALLLPLPQDNSSARTSRVNVITSNYSGANFELQRPDRLMGWWLFPS